MIYYGASDLAASFRTVRKNTLKAAQEIGEEHYGFSPVPGTRTLAQILTHIAVSPRIALHVHGANRMSNFEGFDFMAFYGKIIAEEQVARNKQEILALLEAEGESFAKLLDGMTEEILAERVVFPAGVEPPSKTRFEMLLSAKEHEMHHRSQVMLIERMIGIVPHLTRDMQARFAERQAQKASA